jgi:hypothetical protein
MKHGLPSRLLDGGHQPCGGQRKHGFFRPLPGGGHHGGLPPLQIQSEHTPSCPLTAAVFARCEVETEALEPPWFLDGAGFAWAGAD